MTDSTADLTKMLRVWAHECRVRENHFKADLLAEAIRALEAAEKGGGDALARNPHGALGGAE